MYMPGYSLMQSDTYKKIVNNKSVSFKEFSL